MKQFEAKISLLVAVHLGTGLTRRHGRRRCRAGGHDRGPGALGSAAVAGPRDLIYGIDN